MNGKLRVAYLAPELPALSATFVYNEIFSLQNNGCVVTPISIRQPTARADGKAIEELARSTHILYGKGIFSRIMANARCLLTKPNKFLYAIFSLICDVIESGGVTRNTLGIIYRFSIAAELVTILNKNKIQHVHAHFAHVPGDVAMYASLMSGIPFSITAHANDLFERGWLLKQKCHRAKFFATISEFNKQFLHENSCDTSRVEIIRCGVESRLFTQRTAQSIEQPITIGLLGRFVEKKGIDVLLRAAAELLKKDCQLQLKLAGDGPLFDEMVALSKQLGIESHVNFIGSVPHHAVSSFLNELDIFVLPCVKDSQGDMDGIPVVLMEAMLSGIPVISSELSGLPELVIDGKTGYLTQPGDYQGLAECITRIYQQPKKTQQMVNRAAELVTEQYDLHKNSQKLKRLFEKRA